MKDTEKDKGNENTTNIYGEDGKMPKNLRQIGSVNDMSKVIYVEDYVMSYMKQLSSKGQGESKLAILLGKYVYNEEGKIIFIKGALEMSDVDLAECDVFTEDSWTNVYVNIKEYFSDVEIIGWALVGLGVMFDTEDKIRNIHKENFSGPDKVFFMFDDMEKEESFYISENNQLHKQKGYYIYYEKNEEMQNYMIEQNQKGKSNEDYDDVATKRIKNVIERKDTKKSDKKNDKNVVRFTYVAGGILAAIILLVSTTMLRNYHQMKNLETALNSLTENLETSEDGTDDLQDVFSNTKDEEGETLKEPETDTVEVETVPGNINQTEESENETVEAETNEHEEEVDSEPPATEPTEVTRTEEPEPTEPAPTQEQVEPVNEVKYYIVRSGDTLVSISNELYNNGSQEKINEIIELNNIENQDKIFIGQQLIVP